MSTSRVLINILLFLLVSSLLLNVYVEAARHRKYTAKELRELEEAWAADEDEEELASIDPALRPTPDLFAKDVPLPPQEKQELLFVDLVKKSEYAASKKATSDWSGKVADYLSTGGLHVKGYGVDKAKALFSIQGGMKALLEIKNFLLEKDEVKEVEWNQKVYNRENRK